MKIFILILIGLAGGVIGGMGMGGGTLLIPLISVSTDIEQHIAQAINLIAFVPMSAAALAMHIKNKLVDFRAFLWVAVPAVGMSLLAAYVSKLVGGRKLAMYFGIFLIVLGLYQLGSIIYTHIRNKKSRNKKDGENADNFDAREE